MLTLVTINIKNMAESLRVYQVNRLLTIYLQIYLQNLSPSPGRGLGEPAKRARPSGSLRVPPFGGYRRASLCLWAVSVGRYCLPYRFGAAPPCGAAPAGRLGALGPQASCGGKASLTKAPATPGTPLWGVPVGQGVFTGLLILG